MGSRFSFLDSSVVAVGGGENGGDGGREDGDDGEEEGERDAGDREMGEREGYEREVGEGVVGEWAVGVTGGEWEDVRRGGGREYKVGGRESSDLVVGGWASGSNCMILDFLLPPLLGEMCCPGTASIPTEGGACAWVGVGGAEWVVFLVLVVVE